jgi:hypothetical protein
MAIKKHWTKPATVVAEVSPHDSNTLAHGTPTALYTLPRGLYVGGAGDVEVKGRDGVAATFVAVPAGTILPVEAEIVMSTGTTATAIVALY